VYGWRARIGLIIPDGDSTLEPELWRMAPEGVAIFSARFHTLPGNTSQTDKHLWAMADKVEEATKLLLPLKPTSITFGCTSGSFIGGTEWTEGLIKKINNAAPDIPASTIITAAVAALKELEIKKVAVITPYIKKINDVLKDYLEKIGFEVVNMQRRKGEYKDVYEFQDNNPHENYKLIRSVDVPGAEGIFQSCTGLHAAPIIEKLERDLGKPVITSNIATLWDALRKAKVSEPTKGYGSLLRML